jgi:hypothetical protein
MKIRICGGIGLALLLLPCACSKSSQSDKLPPMQIQGVNVDIPKLSAEFAKAPPDLQSRLNEGIAKVRLNQYLQGMMVFDEVLNNPAVNDKQKQLLTQIIGQLKEVVSKAPAPGNL